MNHGRLVTYAYIYKLNLCGPNCIVCPNVTEDILHVLRDCNPAMTVWKSLIREPYWNRFFETDLQDWIRLNLTNRCRYSGSLE